MHHLALQDRLGQAHFAAQDDKLGQDHLDRVLEAYVLANLHVVLKLIPLSFSSKNGYRSNSAAGIF